MRFIRNSRIRERIIDAVAKGILIAFSALVCLWMISGARAAGADISDIRQHAEADGSYAVEFVLSKPLAKEDIAVEFQRNFIQVSLKGVSAYPARTERLNHSLLEKVFTYQYQPDLARARVLLKGQASAIQGQSSWELDKQTVKLSIRGGVANAPAKTKDALRTRAAAPTERAETSAVDAEEARMREEIIGQVKNPEKTEAAAPAAAKTVTDHESLPLFSAPTEGAVAAKSKESPAAKVFAALLLVVGVIGAGSLAFRRFVQGKGITFQRQGKMIEVISSQSLGPKRSIALVKVLDQHMVVGMSGEGMTLLANLGANVNIDRFSDDIGIGSGASFTDTLQSTISAGGRSEAENGRGAQKSGLDIGFRASLKKRLEGFKPL